VDVAYLYYLPFAMAFTSGDKLHHRLVPLLLREDQSYVPADELKAALREIDTHFDALPDEVKALGVLRFAHFPPSHMDNVVTRLWDKHVRPDWREAAARQEAEVIEPREDGDERVAELTRELAEAEPAPERVLGSEEADYTVITRQVPVKKGKWRMVSKEIEEAGK
jgi:hypothetical protein